MKNNRIIKSNFCALTLVALCLCATTLRAQNMMVKDLTPASDMVARANQAQIASTTNERAIGVCLPAFFNSPGKNVSFNPLSPEVSAVDYFYNYEKRRVEQPSKADVELISGPKHGKLVYAKESDGTLRHEYVPNPDYLGNDKLVFRVKIDGTTVRVVYILKVTEFPIDALGVSDMLCEKIGRRWKISSASDLPTLSLAFADLLGGSVGQTTGTNITLDTNAAEHGWFINTTPNDNDEFLATSDPNVWIARAGSAADGNEQI